MQNIFLQPAYILHSRPYRETSLLLEVFTRDYGLISLVAKGAKRTKRHETGYFQPFTKLLISYFGRHELMTLRHIEASSPLIPLKSDALYCGFYLNELLLRVFSHHEPFPSLFEDYEKTLNQLLCKTQMQGALRLFEWNLLSALGYSFSLEKEAHSGKAIASHQHYCLKMEEGWIAVSGESPSHSSDLVISGESILAFAQSRLTTDTELRDARRLMQLLLAPLLGKKPLNSRSFFM